MINQNQSQLHILCVGQAQSGKTSALSAYCQDKDLGLGIFNIFVKIIQKNKGVVYLHELSQEEPIYLQYSYNAILFFVDLFNNLNASQCLMNWLELLSKHTGINIFNIPFAIILTKNDLFKKLEIQKEKKKILKEFQFLIQSQQQFIFFDRNNMNDFSQNLNIFYSSILQNTSKKMKSNPSMLWKLYGINQLYKQSEEKLQCYWTIWKRKLQMMWIKYK